MPEPHHLHLAAMRHSVADVRYAAKEIDTRAWLATVPHLAPPPYLRPPQRAPAGVTTGRGEARVHVRLSAAERDALAAVAGGADAISSYLRGAGLALPLIVDALESAGDEISHAEAVRVALGIARTAVPRSREQ